MLNFLQKLGGNLTNKLQGNTDVLEGFGAAGALQASADGKATEGEYDTALDIMLNNELLSKAFSEHQIKAALSKMWDIAKSGRRSDRDRLYTEIKQAVDKLPESGRAIALFALDVAESEGGLGDDEKATLNKIAKTSGVSDSELRELMA